MEPTWSPDGDRLYYQRGGVVGRPDAMMSVAVSTQPVLTLGTAPQIQFEHNKFIHQRQSAKLYDITPDGDRFLMVANAELDQTGDDSITPQIIIVQHWFEELKEKVPTP